LRIIINMDSQNSRDHLDSPGFSGP
jgi:hypothetical protein